MAGKRDWGRIRQLPSGRWQTRYPGPDGKLRPAPQTFERKADASNWLANKRAEINRDEWIGPDAGKVSFGVYAVIWIKESDLAETTAERYEGIFRNHVQPYPGDRALSDIKEPIIRQWRKKLQDAGVGAATVAKTYRMVHSMFNTAVDLHDSRFVATTAPAEGLNQKIVDQLCVCNHGIDKRRASMTQAQTADLFHPS